MKKMLTLAMLVVMVLGACEKEKHKTVTPEQSLSYMVALSDDGVSEHSHPSVA